ncbi:hypothetical protein CRI93_10865 [Longimonas halophila]|uniref:DUF4382 domain-containing protein n=1 Tax=Longimonas halophila TaxID=1469170 RepID=A0A2H3NVP2_9BACT|nr:hypothetical protein CRI93_10865 [Longimonas halophila]
MNTPLSRILPLFLLAFAVGLAGCDSTDSNNTNSEARLSLAFTTTTSATAALTARSTTLSDSGNNELTIDRVQLAISELELDRSDDDGNDDNGERDDIERGPMVIDLPLAGEGPVTFAGGIVEAGSWDELEFEIDRLERDDDDEARVLDEANFPEDTSIRVEGTYTLAGGEAQPFVFTTDLEAEQELEFEPPVTVSPESEEQITLSVRLNDWFRQSDGTLINPDDANAGGAFEDNVEDRIQDSIDYEEDDDDSDDDDDDS